MRIKAQWAEVHEEPHTALCPSHRPRAAQDSAHAMPAAWAGVGTRLAVQGRQTGTSQARDMKMALSFHVIGRQYVHFLSQRQHWSTPQTPRTARIGTSCSEKLTSSASSPQPVAGTQPQQLPYCKQQAPAAKVVGASGKGAHTQDPRSPGNLQWAAPGDSHSPLLPPACSEDPGLHHKLGGPHTRLATTLQLSTPEQVPWSTGGPALTKTKLHAAEWSSADSKGARCRAVHVLGGRSTGGFLRPTPSQQELAFPMAKAAAGGTDSQAN